MPCKAHRQAHIVTIAALLVLRHRVYDHRRNIHGMTYNQDKTWFPEVKGNDFQAILNVQEDHALMFTAQISWFAFEATWKVKNMF